MTGAYAERLMEESKPAYRRSTAPSGLRRTCRDDYAATVDQRRIDRHAREAGAFSRAEWLPGDTSLPRVLASLDELDRGARVSGILVLRPLPAHLPAGRGMNGWGRGGQPGGGTGERQRLH